MSDSIALTNGMECPTGTLISGTTHPADVIPALAHWVDFYANSAYHDTVEQARVDEDLEDYLYGEGRGSAACVEDVSWLLEQFSNAVQGVLPDGYYFGTHWGDGADWGIWPTA